MTDEGAVARGRQSELEPAMVPTEVAVALELSLLTPQVRADRERLETLLHPDFVEVGASGRRWTRDEIIEALVDAPTSEELERPSITARALTDDVVLLTYTTRRGAMTVHRSSIWVLHGGQWVVVHHQGTPAAAPETGGSRPVPLRRSDGPSSS